MGNALRAAQRKHRGAARHPFKRLPALIGAVFSATAGRCAVPFASGYDDGSSSLAPLLVIAVLAYYVQRVVVKTMARGPRNEQAQRS